MAVDAICKDSGLCPPNMISPFAYTWQSMEFVALVTLRTRWDALFYTRPNCYKRVANLRPGADFEQASIGALGRRQSVAVREHEVPDSPRTCRCPTDSHAS